MSCSIAGLSNDLLLEIMDKLSCRSLATLRQTCSGLDSLVENYRHQFAKNCQEKMQLDIAIRMSDKEKLKLTYFVRDTQIHDPVRQLSAMGISEVTILFDRSKCSLEDDSQVIPELVDVFKKLRISPEIVDFIGVSDHLVQEVLLQLKPQNIGIGHAPQDFDYEKISQMPVVQKAKKMEMASWSRGVVEEYEKIKGMTSAEFWHSDRECVMRFIRSVLNTKTFGRLRTIEFDLSTESETIQQLFESVDDLQQIRAQFFTSFDELDDPKGLLKSHVVNSYIFLVDLNATHQMIIAEKQETWVTIKICKKSSSALLEALVELVFHDAVDISPWEEDFAKAESLEKREEIFWDLVYDVIDVEEADDETGDDAE